MRAGLVFALAGGLSLALVPVAARAQEFPPMFQGLALDQMNAQMLERNLDRLNDGPVRHNGHAAHGPAGGTTRFKPSAAVTRKSLAGYVAWARAHNPRAADALARAYAKEPPARMWQALVRPDGVRANDLADAYGEYWAMVWSLATGRSKSPDGTRGVVEQFRPMLANPRRGPLSDAAKQAYAEALMLNQIGRTLWIADKVKTNDRAGIDQASRAAAAEFRKAMGVDPTTLRLTEHGFARA